LGSHIGKAFSANFIMKLTLAQNVFEEKLGRFGLNSYAMMAVDLLHEFELGVWKAVFKHLVRILYAISPGGDLVRQLDHRF
jgi:hypothetical protein